jgi:hypothetical protein
MSLIDSYKGVTQNRYSVESDKFYILIENETLEKGNNPHRTFKGNILDKKEYLKFCQGLKLPVKKSHLYIGLHANLGRYLDIDIYSDKEKCKVYIGEPVLLYNRRNEGYPKPLETLSAYKQTFPQFSAEKNQEILDLLVSIPSALLEILTETKKQITKYNSVMKKNSIQLETVKIPDIIYE